MVITFMMSFVGLTMMVSCGFMMFSGVLMMIVTRHDFCLLLNSEKNRSFMSLYL